MRPLVVGTAGHIDHGKSALVKALTGIDPDRLPEEKRRGISIELGFAHGELAPGRPVAFVDVPGHERFVRAMVAGAQGVDLALLVVAIDEGVRPQTREHAAACRFLGIERAVVVLSKADLAPRLDPQWPALVVEEVRALGPPFAEARVVTVSAHAQEGLEALRSALEEAARDLPERAAGGPAFLPVDRVFSIPGHGTVVTGTLAGGQLEPSIEVELVSPGPRVARRVEGLRVRGLQTHGRAAPRAVAGQRVAVNLPGVEVAQVARGSAIVGSGPGACWSSAVFEVELELAPGAAPIGRRTRAHWLVGTAHALATIDLLGLEELGPGERTVAQVRLDRAVPGRRGQRFVLLSDEVGHDRRGRIFAGGRVLLPSSRRRRAKDRTLVQRLAGDADAALQVILMEAGLRGLPARRAEWLLGAQPHADARVVRQGTLLFDAAQLEGLAERVRAEVRRGPGRAPAKVRASIGDEVAAEAFAWALERLGPEFAVGPTLDLASRLEDDLERRVRLELEKGGRTPPTVSELAAALKKDPYAIGGALRALARREAAVKLGDDLFVSVVAARRFRDEVAAELAARGPLTTPELKECAGVSRKFLVPLLEWLDREHVTLRVGDRRRLRGAP